MSYISYQRFWIFNQPTPPDLDFRMSEVTGTQDSGSCRHGRNRQELCFNIIFRDYVSIFLPKRLLLESSNVLLMWFWCHGRQYFQYQTKFIMVHKSLKVNPIKFSLLVVLFITVTYSFNPLKLLRLHYLCLQISIHSPRVLWTY